LILFLLSAIDFNYTGSFDFFFVAIIVVCLLMWRQMLIPKMLPLAMRRSDRIGRIDLVWEGGLIATCIVVVMAIAVIPIDFFIQTAVGRGIVASLLFYAIFELLLIGVEAVRGIFRIVFVYYAIRAGAYSWIVDDALVILRFLERPPTLWWKYPQLRNGIRYFLEDIALTIERHERHFLQSIDPVTAPIHTQILMEIATGFRMLKLWLLTAKPDTRALLIERLVHDLTCLVQNEWDGLERVKVEEPIRTRSWQGWLVYVVKTMIVAALPALLLWFMQQNPSLALSEPLLSYMRIGVLIWAAITVLFAADPNLAAKVTALKDVSALIQASGKSGSKTP
jgi:hypothetical protein